jgi:hypothetical protein
MRSVSLLVVIVGSAGCERKTPTTPGTPAGVEYQGPGEVRQPPITTGKEPVAGPGPQKLSPEQVAAAYRGRVAEYLAAVRAAAKVMGGTPTVEDVLKSAEAVGTLGEGLERVPAGVDAAGEIKSQVRHIGLAFSGARIVAVGVREQEKLGTLTQPAVDTLRSGLERRAEDVRMLADELETTVWPNK